MKHGKKSKAIKLLNSVFYHLWILSKKDIFSLILFKKGLLNLMPFYEQYTYKQSGQTNIETILVYKKKRRLFLLFKNLKTDLKQKKKQTSAFILASLIYNSYLKIGKYKDFQQERINLLKNYPQLRFRW